MNGEQLNVKKRDRCRRHILNGNMFRRSVRTLEWTLKEVHAPRSKHLSSGTIPLRHGSCTGGDFFFVPVLFSYCTLALILVSTATIANTSSIIFLPVFGLFVAV